jgi:hypothetical protein
MFLFVIEGSKKVKKGCVINKSFLPLNLDINEAQIDFFPFRKKILYLRRDQFQFRHAKRLQQGPVDGVAELHGLLSDGQDVWKGADHLKRNRIPLDLKKKS